MFRAPAATRQVIFQATNVWSSWNDHGKCLKHTQSNSQ